MNWHKRHGSRQNTGEDLFPNMNGCQNFVLIAKILATMSINVVSCTLGKMGRSQGKISEIRQRETATKYLEANTSWLSRKGEYCMHRFIF